MPATLDPALTDALDGIKTHLDGRVDALEADFLARKFGRTDAPAKSAYAADGLLTKSQKIADAVDRSNDDSGPERLGAMLHAVATKATGHLSDSEVKAVSGVSSPDGGILIPEAVSASVIDLARTKTRVLEAGAMTMPMTSRYVVMPKLMAGSQAAWRSENDAIAEGDPDLGYVRLQAQSLAAIVRISWEILEDSSPDVWAMIAADLTAELGKKIDYAALRGAGFGSEPLGITGSEGINQRTAIGAPSYDDILDAMADIESANHEASAWLLNSRDSRTYRGLKTGISGDKTTLSAPADVAALKRLVTNQLPADEGAGDNESSMVVGDFSQLVIGVRPSLSIRLVTLSERYAENGQKALIAWFRGDVAVRHPEAFTVLSGVTA
jgi:HK97 family phage major capsid protein